jgi:hypothetical protein
MHTYLTMLVNILCETYKFHLKLFKKNQQVSIIIIKPKKSFHYHTLFYNYRFTKNMWNDMQCATPIVDHSMNQLDWLYYELGDSFIMLLHYYSKDIRALNGMNPPFHSLFDHKIA